MVRKLALILFCLALCVFGIGASAHPGHPVDAVVVEEVQPAAAKAKLAAPDAVLEQVPSASKIGPSVEVDEVDDVDPDAPVIALGDLVIVSHSVSVFSSDKKDIDELPTVSESVGWLEQIEPEYIISMTRWPGTDSIDPQYHNFKRFPVEVVVSVRKVVHD